MGQGARRSRGTAGLLLAALLAGCASGAAGPPPEPQIEALEFAGAKHVDADEIASYLRTPRPGRWPWSPEVPFDAPLLEEDVARVVDLYRQRGYYSTRAQSRIEWNAERDRARIAIEIDEGLPVIVERRRVELAPVPDSLTPEQAAAVQDALPGGEGEVFDVREYVKAKELIVRRLADSGYLTAAVRGGADVDVEERSARIAWTVDPGPLILLGPVGIQGLEHVDRKLLDEELAGERGRPLPLRWLEETQRQLASLGWFHSVTVKPLPAVSSAPDGGVQTWPVLVEVDERPPRTVQAAIGYTTEEQVRGKLGWEHRQLLGAGRTLRLGARASAIETRGEVAIGWPKFLFPATTAELSFNAGSETLESYDARTLSFKFDVKHTLGPRTVLQLGHRIEFSDPTDVSDSAEDFLDDPQERTRVSVSRLELEHIGTDNPLNPTRGAIGRIGLQLAPTALGSEVDYWGGDVELRYYRPWSAARSASSADSASSAVWATRLRMATLLPLRTTEPEEIPLTERLFAGGTDTVRGYDYQRLGPLDDDDEPLGGTTLLVANLELRVPIRGKLSGVVFADGGLVDLEPFNFRLSNMRYSSGVGLRFDTPVGPLRLDVGFLLNRPGDEDRVRLHLSVGQAF